MASTKVGLAAARPAQPVGRGTRYVARDTNQEWVSDGSDWIETSSVAAGPVYDDVVSVGGGGQTIYTVTGAEVVFVDTGDGAVLVNLPAAPASGQKVRIIRSGFGLVNVGGNGALIVGSATITQNLAWIDYHFAGGAWLAAPSEVATPSSEVVAIMRHGVPLTWTSDGQYRQIGATVPVVGDGARWARVDALMPSLSVLLPDDSGQKFAEGSVGIGSPDQTVFYQDAYVKWFNDPNTVGVDAGRGGPVAVTALIPPWVGSIPLALLVYIGPAGMAATAEAQDTLGYSMKTEMTVTMFDAPATIL